MSATKTERLVRAIERTECQRRIAERHTPERLCLLDADLTKLRLDLLKERHRQARKAQQR